MNRTLLLGYIELAAAQTCIGMNVVTGKILANDMPIFELLAVRFFIGFLLMAAISHLSGHSVRGAFQRFYAFSRQDKLLLLLQAACGGFLFNVFILYGMKSTSATSAGIISAITPIMILLLAAFILREKLTAQKLLAVLVTVAGLVVVHLGATSHTEDSVFGNLLVLVAVIPEALFTIVSKHVGNKLNQIEAVTLVNFFNFIYLVPLCFFSFDAQALIHLSGSHAQLILLYGLSGGVLFFLLWYRGLTKVNANTAAIFTGVMPVSTAIMATTFLHEPFRHTDLIGMILVIVAIVIGCIQPRSRRIAEAAGEV